VATGLALTLFGVGLSALVGQGYQATNQVPVTKMPIPLLSDIPVVGPILFRHDGVVYLSLVIVAAVFVFLSRSRAGMILRAVGENHDAAHALGYNVRRVRLMAIAFGGACAGLGGAYISLARVPQWVDNITAGTGWIALAIVVFASWKPWRLLIGAYLFGGVTALQINIQAMGLDIPVEYLSMSPYIATILVLVFLSGGRAPGSLGRIFHASS
jgi:simple sugar transport system permease protein